MSHFTDSVIAIAPVNKSKGRERFLRDWDQWTERLFRKDLISIGDMHRMRREIVDSHWESRR